MQPIRLLLVEDHLIVRAALRLLLSEYPLLQVVAEADDCRSALEMVEREHPDIVLLDILLANACAIDCISDLRALSPQPRILMLTGVSDEKLYARAMSEGAHGVVRKEEPPEVLVQAITRIHNGHLWFDAHFDLHAQPTALNSPARKAPPTGWSQLTEREREIIKLIGEGMKNRSIAAHIEVSEKTVQNHLSSIFRKLGVRDRLALAALAHRFNRLDPQSK